METSSRSSQNVSAVVMSERSPPFRVFLNLKPNDRRTEERETAQTQNDMIPQTQNDNRQPTSLWGTKKEGKSGT